MSDLVSLTNTINYVNIKYMKILRLVFSLILLIATIFFAVWYTLELKKMTTICMEKWQTVDGGLKAREFTSCMMI